MSESSPQSTSPAPVPSGSPASGAGSAGSSGTGVFALVIAAAGILVFAGLALALTDPSPERRMVGCALLVAGTLAALLSAVLVAVQSQIRRAREEAAKANAELLASVNDHLSNISVMLNVVTEQQLISDRAKSIAYRDKDRDALRRAIREESGRGDFESAKKLVDEMEAAFGLRQEADRIRGEIMQAWTTAVQARLRENMEKIDRLCRAEDWAGAQHLATTFISQYPDFPPARQVPNEIESRKAAFKKKLLDRWNDCVLHHNGEEGMDVLRLLDPYLTPSEAELMAESARSIFNDRKAKLREQFSVAAKENRWSDAIKVGEVIQTEFPNAKFAQEVADLMDTLRQRAAEASAEKNGSVLAN